MPGSPGTQHQLLQVPGRSTGYHNWAAKLLIDSAGNPPSSLLQPASLMHISSLFLVLKERAHSVLRLKPRSLSITACYTPTPDAALQLFCHIWCPESPSSASEGSYGKLPSHLSSPENRWKQSLLTSPRGTSPLLLLHNLCCFSGYLQLGFLPESRLVGEVANSPLCSGRDMQGCCKCIPSHPDVPSFTVNLTSQMTPQPLSIPLREGLARSTIPLLG